MGPPPSSPKRVTRARAAGKASTATAGTASSAARKTATVAAKANATRTTAASTAAVSATRTSTKRKTRPDEHEDDSEAEAPTKLAPTASRTAARATRGPGRPRKTVDSKSASTPAPTAPRATRGRPPKKPVTVPAKEEAPAKGTRTRAKRTKVEHDDDVDDLAPDSVKKPTRGRPVGSTTSARATASKSSKKTVSFAEPDKENVLPVSGPKAKTSATKPAETTTAGMRGKPVRKPAAAGRTAQSTATKKNTDDKKENTKDSSDKASMPLSPKKVTQLSAHRDQDLDSEDELAMDRTPARLFRRSPVKPPVIVKAPVEDKDEDTADEETAALAPTEPTFLLGSPVRRPPPSAYKDSMKSPAKRIEGVQLGLPAVNESSQAGASPSKAPLMQSPAKKCPVSLKPVELTASSQLQSGASPFKQSLFQSPARRLFSPAKTGKLPVPRTGQEAEDVFQSPAPTPVLLCTPAQAPSVEESEGTEANIVAADSPVEGEAKDGQQAGPSDATDFHGRMSEVLPRKADPALDQNTSLVDQSIEEEDDGDTVVLEDGYQQENANQDHGGPMALDEPAPEAEDIAPDSISTTPPNSPPRQALSMLGLGQEDQVSLDQSYSESEDEISRVMTPKSVSPVKHMKGGVMKPRTSGLGFTPLAQRFDSWQAHSPVKDEVKASTPTAKASRGPGETAAASQDSPMKDTFFEDEIASRPDEAGSSSNESEPPTGIPEIKDPVCEDISLTDEDFELVAEANEMSGMSPEQVQTRLSLDSNDDTMSEASQEYGDENEVPVANAHGGTPVPPVTPQRYTTREFHTVSKVPLKPADESTPPPQPSLRKRRHSISKVPAGRPSHVMTRSATVISYSPTKKKDVEPAFEEAAEEEDSRSRAGSVPPVTPTKSETWSNAATPIQTPIQTPRQVNSALLRGAVVFVDVHTMEGADASAIFVELLTQMGARCVKTWNWNSNDEDASSKIGITHVVYKDGGKRTMERVRETGGVVQCVGVGWVLDCERENEWLDEAPYYIDTSLLPRGGARRRKSMEPKALANNNGTVVSDSGSRRSSGRQSQTGPTTPAPANRRDSTLWMHSPEDYEDGEDEDQENEDIDFDAHDWLNSAPLTPVPKTPAPEAIHRYAMDMTPDMDSPTSEDDDDEELSHEQLMQRTCPPKAQHIFENLGEGLLGRNKDENVARRLMDARRKSLAFAPRVSSPLAKSWKDWN